VIVEGCDVVLPGKIHGSLDDGNRGEGGRSLAVLAVPVFRRELLKNRYVSPIHGKQNERE